MTTDIELGALLRRLRESRKEPLRVVAAASDMDSTLLSRIERGERVPTERQTEALARHFGIPVEELRPMRNAARMMRQWIDPDEVLRAADVIERSSGSAVRGSSRSTAFDALESRMLHSYAAAPEPAARLSGPAGDTASSRGDKLDAIEAAAAAGAEALDALERASRDRDSVVALRATELARQLRAKLG